MLNIPHNPDILTCLADLSSDEVFTPPGVANQMLDQLPKEIWSDDSVTFLDPVSKSGVFLREITKRLLDGLENKIPDIEQRLAHILKKQVFGIATTRLTSQISRRTLYCSKKANGKYSIVNFDDEEGNLRIFESVHFWADGKKCKYCGVSRDLYQRDKGLESYAYSFIHEDKPEELFNMKFDVIIGNPPYQMMDGGSGASAIPIYHKFVEAAKKLKPRFISMIIPSRWFAGGKGLNDFRDEMLSDTRVKYLNDFINAKECFPGVSLGGGVNYFLWERDYDGPCEVVNTKDGKQNSSTRKLNEYPIFIRNNIGIDIVNKVTANDFVSVEEFIKPRNVFGFVTKDRGSEDKINKGVQLHHSQGIGYVNQLDIPRGKDFVDMHKIMISSRTSEHAGEPDKSGQYRVLSTSLILPPKHICTDSYLMVGPFKNKKTTENFLNYMRTKFFRYLLSQATTGIQFTREKFRFIPKLDDYDVTDEELYSMFKLSKEETNEIETTIKVY